MNASLRILCVGVLLPASLFAQPRRELPAPDVANARYGPHERNVLDLWKAKSETPTPVVVYIHGGGFRTGDKRTLNPVLLAECLKSGYSVAAVNYRLSPNVSFPAHYLDCGRAIQFLRHHAREHNLDSIRIAATGGSAGAGTSLWLGFHDDLADPRSEDPLLRESTRLTCMAVLGAQSTYDPRVIKEIIGGRAHEHPALDGFYGLTPEERDTPKAHKLYEDAAPITHLSAGDPPVLAFYNEPKGPLPANARPGQGIHHPNFGTYLEERMDQLDIECTLLHSDDRPDLVREMVSFFGKHFEAASKASDSRAPDNQLTSAEKDAGWVLLFDGKSLEGWQTSSEKPSQRPVENGALNPHKCGGYMLIHKETRENFQLALDFKLSPKCNSGIFLRTFPLTPRPGKDVGFNGIEVALDDTTTAGFHDTGALYDLVKPTRNAMKPAGEWNHIVITCDQTRIEVELNGEPVTKADLSEWIEPNKRPDGTPHKFDVAFKDHPRRGYIGLQDHGADCWFRNIKLLPLK
jgi:acetyl esterase/lipase